MHERECAPFYAWMRCPRFIVCKGKKFRIRFSFGEVRYDEMKKLALVVTIAVMAALNAQSAAHQKVQLWEGGPYWATTNIGAEKPEDYGLYFWWGDTVGHRPTLDGTFNFNFSSSNSDIYTYGKSVSELKSAGWVTSDGMLAPEHDAAHVKWGSGWRMPTSEEMKDLCNKCDWIWTTMNGVNGYAVRGRGAYASNSIFLPAAGSCYGTSLNNSGSYGHYWSSVPTSGYSKYASELRFNSNGHSTSDARRRYYGQSVRPVQGFGEATDCVIHFNANGGVFKDKEGSAVTQFDQHFTYGESKLLFTDELTPMRMDGNGNIFLGWSKGTPNISSSDQLIASGGEWTWDDDETEVTFYAVWTTTLTVSFYNSETTSGDKSLSPSFLADHLRWSVDDGSAGGRKTLGCGESIEVCPGRRTVQLYCDDNYKWFAGEFGFAGHEPLLNMVNDAFELDIVNDFSILSAPSPAARDIFVKAEPVSGGGLKAEVQFLCSSEIRESLRNSIRPEDVPFDDSKVRITIERAAYNQWGSIELMNTGGMTGLEAYKLYPIPKGLYYIKDVSYNVDTSDGAPYWGAVLGSSLDGRLFEVDDNEYLKEVTIKFDMFGGLDVAKVEFDPQGGECKKTVMWFEYFGGIEQGARIDKKLPKAKKEGVEFVGWFTAKSGGQWKTEGSDISSCTLFAHWTQMTRGWIEENAGALFPELANLDIVMAANTTAANGCRTVGECYELGIDPEDSDDDLKIAEFKMKDGKPMITLNHTKDGSGNSFEDRVKILGKAELTDAEWQEVPPEGNPAHRFFKVGVEMP